VLLGTSAINPDELTQAVAGAVSGVAGEAANLVGVERAEKAVWRAIAEGKSVAIETVLSTDKFLPTVAAAVLRGYRTRLVFVSLPDVEMAIDRVKARVKMGGHGVPEERIRRRWQGSHARLATFLRQVDDLVVFSNASVNEPVLVAERIGSHSKVRWFLPEALPDVVRALRGY
jgi:predicted ABC-type ATPase